MRIRHYGITANCRRREKLARCRESLGQTQAAPNSEPNPGEPGGSSCARSAQGIEQDGAEHRIAIAATLAGAHVDHQALPADALERRALLKGSVS
jgi:hypothetical protein